MELNLYSVKTNFSKVIQQLIDGEEEIIIITKNGKPVVQMTPIIKKNSKKIGAAKNEMKGFDISLEEFDSIEIEDFGEYL